MQARILSSFLFIGVALASCAPKPPLPPAPPPLPPLPPHAGPPPAISCDVAPFHVVDGGSADLAMVVSNDGGYCAATLTDTAGTAFDAPLVPALPLHGTPRVVPYNGKTSVEYTPIPGYVGQDSFIVKLIVRGHPGYTTLRIAVTVKAK